LRTSDRSKNPIYWGFGNTSSDKRLSDVGGRGVR